MKFPVKALKNNQQQRIKNDEIRHKKLAEKQKKIFTQAMTMKVEKLFMRIPEEKLPTEADKERRRAQLARMNKKSNM
jgi:hypothetical protein